MSDASARRDGIRRSRTPRPRRCSATASCCRSCPGPGASDYERYLRTDELLALQKTPEEMVHRDELLFQTVHQSSELWLKLAVLRDRGGDRAHRRRRPHARRAPARPGEPLRHPRRPTRCTCSSGSRPGSTTWCAPRSATAAASTRRAGVTCGASRRRSGRRSRRCSSAAASSSPTSTCASAEHPDRLRPRRGADRVRRAHRDLALGAREDGAARDRRTARSARREPPWRCSPA